jgi:hypothetical protein
MRWLRHRSAMPFLWVAAFVALLPTSNLVVTIGSVRADRFWYLPLAFVALGATAGLRWLRLHFRQRPSPALADRGVQVIAVVWVVSLALIAHVRTYDWRDNRTLWEAAVLAAPHSYKAHLSLATYLNGKGSSFEDLHRALVHAGKSCEILENPEVRLSDRRAMPYVTLGAILSNLADVETGSESAVLIQRAESVFKEGIRVVESMKSRFLEDLSARGVEVRRQPQPYVGQVYTTYAEFLLRCNRPVEALNYLSPLLKMNPADPTVRELASRAAQQMRDWNAVIEHGVSALLLGFGSANTVRSVAQAIAETEGRDQPIDAYVRVNDTQQPTLNLDNERVASVVNQTGVSLRALLEAQKHDVAVAQLDRKLWLWGVGRKE